MKILQIYDLNPTQSTGGVEVAILQLSKELIKLGHEVTILTGASNKKCIDFYDGINIINIDFFGIMKYTHSSGNLTLLRQTLFLASIISNKLRVKYDIYHGHIYSSGLIASYLAKVNNSVAVNTIHGSYYPVWNIITHPASAFFYKRAEKFLVSHLAKNTHQIHVSTYFSKQVSEWGGEVRVILNGVNTDVFHPNVKPKFKSSIPIILTARRLVKKNGIEYLIKAMEELKGECRLIIIGDGQEKKKLLNISKNMENITFLNSVPYYEMPYYIASADIIAVPSIIEAGSLFMLEAMAMGKPIIASDVGGIPEILGDCGILIPPMKPDILAYEIRELIYNSKKKEILGKKAYLRVKEKYSWEKTALEIEKEYLKLINDKNV